MCISIGPRKIFMKLRFRYCFTLSVWCSEKWSESYFPWVQWKLLYILNKVLCKSVLFFTVSSLLLFQILNFEFEVILTVFILGKSLHFPQGDDTCECCYWFMKWLFTRQPANQQTFTCSKSEIETLEEGVQYFQNKQ